MTARQAGSAPGTVKVRLSGDGADLDAVVEMLRALRSLWDLEVLDESDPYPNRRGSGERVYLTVRRGRDGAR